MSTPKYKVGDKVVIVSKKTKDMHYYEWMTRYFCTIMTIREIVPDSKFPYRMEEDFDDPVRPFGWDWSDNMIDHEATAKLNNKEKKIMETKAKIIIDGKEFEVTLPDSVIAELTKPKRVTGFERADYDEVYYYIDGCGDISCYTDHHASASEEYNAANYYTNETLAEWCCRADTLNRKMRRWAAEHNTEPIKWGCKNRNRHVLTYDYDNDKLLARDFNVYLHPNQIYFSSKEIAESAIAEFGDEIKWLAENRPEWF